MPNLKIRGLSIVLVGDFNPKIFQPAWFASEGLISKSETDDAHNIVITEQLSAFNCSWVRFVVESNRFIASTSNETHFEAVRDVVVGTFKILRHTPIKEMGVNFESHFLFESETAWNDFGDKLAPKGPWRTLMHDPGLLAMTIVEKKPMTDGLPSFSRIDVENSNRIRPGVFVRLNTHFQRNENSSLNSANDLTTILQDRFQSLITSSNEVTNKIIGI